VFRNYLLFSLVVSLIVSILFIGTSNFSEHAYAQNGDNMTQPDIGETITWQGTASSMQDPLKGHESHQAVVILPPREDQAIYSGIISFIASKPVEVVTLHDYTLGNVTIPDNFGVVMTAPTPWREGGEVATAMMALDYPTDTPTYSANVPFVGNAVGLHTTNGDQFVATYTVSAQLLKAETMNNVESAVNSTE
jgi:hypothetical protein